MVKFKSVNFIYIIFTCFTVLAFSCTREKVRTVGWPYWGEAFALRNGEEWHPKVQAAIYNKYPDKLTINFDWFHPIVKYRRERLGFTAVNHTIILDTFIINKKRNVDQKKLPFATYLTFQDDGDVLGDWYDVLETEENYLIVTAWDAEKEEIEGKFQVSFLFRGGVHNTPDATDTVRFEDGYFHTKVTNK